MIRTPREVDPLTQAEAVEFLDGFLESRGGMDSILDARLIHFPRRGDSSTREVRVFSGWERSVIWLRIELEPKEGAEGKRFLFRGGDSPGGWVMAEDGEVERLPAENLFRPLLPGIDLSAFDLTAPYLDWASAAYDGSERVSDSPVHWFLFEPPQEWKGVLESAGIEVFRVAIDARYAAPVRVEYLDFDDNPVRSLEVRSFKKFDNTWIVRRLEAFDEGTRDRTELHVDEAEVEIRLPEEIFLPSGLGKSSNSLLGLDQS